MSKTLVGIIETAGIVALNFIPGVGNALSGVLGVSLNAARAIGTVAIGLIGAGVDSLLTRHTPPETTQTAVKMPIPPRVSAYGKTPLPFAVEYAE